MFLHNVGPFFVQYSWIGYYQRHNFLGNLLEKISIFGVQTGEWASITAWACNKDFRVFKIKLKFMFLSVYTLGVYIYITFGPAHEIVVLIKHTYNSFNRHVQLGPTI